MVVVNRVALVAWAFAFAFLLMVVVLTTILVRNGPASGSTTVALGLLAAIWLGGLSLASYASSRPYVRLEITSEGLTVVTWRYPFRRVVRMVSPERVSPATVIRSQDDEGLPHFVARVVLDDGTAIDLAEGRERAACDDICAGFNQVLSGRASTDRRA